MNLVIGIGTLAEKLGIKRSQVVLLMERRIIPFNKYGHKTIGFDLAEVEKCLKEHGRYKSHLQRSAK